MLIPTTWKMVNIPHMLATYETMKVQIETILLFKKYGNLRNPKCKSQTKVQNLLIENESLETLNLLMLSNIKPI